MSNLSPQIAGLGGDEPQPASRRPRLWVELVVAIVLAGFLALLGIGFLGNAAHRDPAGNAIGAAICFGLTFLCSRWAIHTEHRLRAHQPLAQSFTGAPSFPASSATTATPIQDAPAARATSRRRAATPRRTVRRGRRYSPVGSTIVALVLGAGTAALAVNAVVMRSHGARSSFVQSHGVQEQATVDDVNNSQDCGRYGCTYSAAISVTLARPVGGTMQSVAHYPDTSNLNQGQQITVLVDPEEPTYSEIPGSKLVDSGSWIASALLALACGALLVLDIRATARIHAHRRAAAAGPTASGTPA
ncbi:MAG: hypothetical protein ACLP01_17030 [Solirubrobacteraceae bacterium]